MCWSLAARERVPPMSRRSNDNGQQKIAMLREHLVENVPVSEVCKTHGISVVNFYNWQKILFEEGAALFERKPNASNVRRQEAAAVLFRQAMSRTDPRTPRNRSKADGHRVVREGKWVLALVVVSSTSTSTVALSTSTTEATHC